MTDDARMNASSSSDWMCDALPCGVMRISDDADGRILYMNDAAREMLRGAIPVPARRSSDAEHAHGSERAGANALNALDALLPALDEALRADAAKHPSDVQELLSLLSPTWRDVFERSLKALPAGGVCNETMEIHMRGESRWVKSIVRRLPDGGGYLCVWTDVTREAHITRVTHRDALTGVYTREAFESLAIRRTAAAIGANRRYALFVLRVLPPESRAPHVSEFQDAVRSLAEALGTMFRSEDIIARLSEGELIVWMTDAPPIPVVTRKGAEIARVVNERVLPHGWTCVVGTGVCPEHGLDYVAVYRKARAGTRGKDARTARAHPYDRLNT